MLKNIKKYNFILAIIIAVVMIVPMSVGAITQQGNEVAETNSNSSTNSTNGSESATNNNLLNSVKANRLEGKSLEKCQTREMAIKNIMNRVADRSQKQVELIESIEQKVQSFYSSHELQIEDYDAVMSNVEEKKMTAIKTMENVREMKSIFSCGQSDPKGDAENFKTQTASQTSAAIEYKDAVVSLAEQVKQAYFSDSVVSEEI